ncbi:MAG TPA: hypothetical protein VKK79_22425, partial [Candidatus Lokiarchaeia archaeon]|nr:hypothetical protein [Candidatus Lokiarchaeia archaeon]
MVIAAVEEARDARFNGRATKEELAKWKEHVRNHNYGTLSHFLRLAAFELMKHDSEESEATAKQAELET